LRGILRPYRQRQCKHGERSEDHTKYLPGFHSILPILCGRRCQSCAPIPVETNCYLWGINRFAHLRVQICAEWLMPHRHRAIRAG
jgi:hypothetical protein